jgi:transposase InsO family protein
MILALFRSLLSALATRQTLFLENLALRQQLAVLQRDSKRPRLMQADRVFWVFLSRIWNGWARTLTLVKPETVIGWHRKGFKLYWRWKSRGASRGRPAVAPEIRKLIRTMSRANPLWGAPRIHGELLKLGIEVSQPAVSKYMVRTGQGPSQSWRTFLDNHLKELVSVDFFTVPTLTFQVLFVFVVLSHERRRIVHFDVTRFPTAKWTALQIVQAFPRGTAPRYLLRDRDGTYGHDFVRRMDSFGIEEVKIAPRSPWQNPYAERFIGTLRRDCLNHLIVLSENHLRRTVREYLSYYHTCRTHLSLDKDTPESRPIEPPGTGKVIEIPRVGGLHHRYTRRAA